jgi:hypothetical protein
VFGLRKDEPWSELVAFDRISFWKFKLLLRELPDHLAIVKPFVDAGSGQKWDFAIVPELVRKVQKPKGGRKTIKNRPFFDS